MNTSRTYFNICHNWQITLRELKSRLLVPHLLVLLTVMKEILSVRFCKNNLAKNRLEFLAIRI